MATILASQIVNNVRNTLQDTTPGGMRHKDNELLEWLNAAQRAIVLHRPEAGAVSERIPLAAGSKQYLPPGGIQLLDVERNESTDGTAGRAVTITDRRVLDQTNADWHTQTATDTVYHYTFDENDPEHFYVYPPSDSAGTHGASGVTSASRYVRATFSKSPTAVADLTDTITIHDTWSNALMDYILFRAYGKDSTYAGNFERSKNHYQLFAETIGLKVEASTMNDPNKIRQGIVHEQEKGI